MLLLKVPKTSIAWTIIQNIISKSRTSRKILVYFIFSLHVENGYREIAHRNNFYLKVYLETKFYKNSTGQLSNLLFLANPSEHSW